jgi:hypothetical protein
MEEKIDLVADEEDDSDKDLGLADLIDSSNLESNASIDSIKRMLNGKSRGGVLCGD